MTKAKNGGLIAPIVVLVCICLVASALLAGVFHLTDPIIQERSAAAASEARAVVLPDGDAFTLYTGELIQGVEEVYTADNGSGIVCTTAFKGFDGLVRLMIGVGRDGTVKGIEVLDHSETPGMGSNALTESFLGQYVGLANAEEVDGYSGATRTSTAVRNGVTAALQQLQAIKGSDK